MTDQSRRANPIVAGLLSRCPRCAEGRLFAGFLRLADRCPACGLDYAAADPGDGPAVFVIFAVGFIVVPLALALELSGAPIWANILVSSALTIGLSLALLRPFKATLIALQHYHGAREARLDDEQP